MFIDSKWIFEKALQHTVEAMEQQHAAENEKLEKINKAIRTVDAKLDETEYSIRRRRGTLVTLQKMSDKRLQQIGFDKSKLIPLEKDEPVENQKKQITFKDISSKAKKTQVTKEDTCDEDRRKIGKPNLDAQRKLITFKRKVRAVQNHFEETENKLLVQRTKVRSLLDSSKKELEIITRINSDIEKLNI